MICIARCMYLLQMQRYIQLLNNQSSTSFTAPCFTWKGGKSQSEQAFKSITGFAGPVDLCGGSNIYIPVNRGHRQDLCFR